jgi:streptomycin 6-kinase
MQLPDILIRNLHNVHDDAGPWLARLPVTLAKLEAAWNIRVTSLVPQLSYNLVAYAEQVDENGIGTPCILKMCPPSDELILEGEALAYYAGDGFCRLLKCADTVSALLLERVRPGLSLQEVWRSDDDEVHTRVAAGLMRRLWRPVEEPHPFLTLQRWSPVLWKDQEPGILAPLQHRAQATLLYLGPVDLGPDMAPVLLHADLHHGNILTATDEPYRAIDPKGIVGARGYEDGAARTGSLGFCTRDSGGLLGCRRPWRLDERTLTVAQELERLYRHRQ